MELQTLFPVSAESAALNAVSHDDFSKVWLAPDTEPVGKPIKATRILLKRQCVRPETPLRTPIEPRASLGPSIAINNDALEDLHL
jgi:hypothetical protein